MISLANTFLAFIYLFFEWSYIVKYFSDLATGCEGLDGHQFAGRVEDTSREGGPNSRVDWRIRLRVGTPQHSTPGPYLELAVFARCQQAGAIVIPFGIHDCSFVSIDNPLRSARLVHYVALSFAEALDEIE